MMKRKECDEDNFRVEKKVKPSLSLQSFLERLDDVMDAPNDGFGSSEELQALMESIDFDEAEWKKYIYLSKEHYTRNLVASKDFTYDLLLLCWQPGQKSAIHDHNSSGCWMRVLKGDLTESRYQVARDGESLELIKQDVYNSPQVFYINNARGVHCVGNSSSEVGLSLHLYSPPITECQVWTSADRTPNIFKTSLHSIFGFPLPTHMYKPNPKAPMGGKYWPLKRASPARDAPLIKSKEDHEGEPSAAS